MKKLCGIYKIISPNGRIYIGQSRNINQRFNRYKANHISNKTQIKLIRSFEKYGIDNHIFEVIEECSFYLLNIRERYWQDFFNVLIDGLNCILTETDTLPRVQSKETKLKRSGVNHWNFGVTSSDETKEKMRIAKLGISASLETKQKLSKIHKGENNNFYGKKHSEESKKRQSEAAKNRNISIENEQNRRQNISKNSKKPKSLEHNESIRKSKLGENNPMFGKKWKLVDGKRVYYIP